MEMLKVVENPIQYLDSLNIPYSVRKIEPFDPLNPYKFYAILIEYKDIKHIVHYRIIDGKWSYVQ